MDLYKIALDCILDIEWDKRGNIYIEDIEKMIEESKEDVYILKTCMKLALIKDEMNKLNEELKNHKINNEQDRLQLRVKIFKIVRKIWDE